MKTRIKANLKKRWNPSSLWHEPTRVLMRRREELSQCWWNRDTSGWYQTPSISAALWFILPDIPRRGGDLMKISWVTHLHGDLPAVIGWIKKKKKEGLFPLCPISCILPPVSVRRVVVTTLHREREREREWERASERRGGSDYIKQHFPAVP